MIPIAYEVETNSLTIILPALNEADAIGLQIQALLAHPAWHALPLSEIVVVDNGSDDATAAVAQAAGARVITEPQRGYGAACYAGLRAACTDVLFLMDADGSDDLAGAARIAWRVLSGEADLAVGSRVRGRCERGALTLQQRVGNTVAALLMRLLYGVRITDLGPTRAIRRQALLALDPRERTYGWSTEMLVKAARARYRIVEEPVDYHRRVGGVSKVSGTFRGSLRAGYCILMTVLRYARWRPAAAPLMHRGQQPTMTGGKVVHP
ncbi:MAG TPA: glycosyltransferase family 2 protein [Ktedonobacterales bacterium]|nr:glycosyltransferase family 2 protein [Ktedonobacterales bacterium]